MKFTKGKNWWKFNLTKNKAIFYAPTNLEDKDSDKKVNRMSLRIGSRRIKFSFEFDKETKDWSFHYAGYISSNAPKNMHIDYQIVQLMMPEDYNL